MTDSYQFKFGEGNEDAFLRIDQITEETQFTTPSGDTLTATGGDYVVIDGDGIKILSPTEFTDRYPGRTNE